MAEYEALIVGDLTVWQAKVKDLVVCSDSYIVIQQTNNQYGTKDPALYNHLAIVKGLI